MRRVCLVTTSQPSANPRLVKEADALADAGCQVHVVGAHWVDWATEADAKLLARRRWTMSFVDWRRSVNPALWWKSRLRQHAAIATCRVAGPVRHVDELAMTRLAPELTREARRQRADLFIAHNLGALPVALDAAARCGAAVGFDAEDFHSGQLSGPGEQLLRRVTESVERRTLPRCDYVTAAAPLIADAYARLCAIPRPTVVLNVFPRALRPTALPVRDTPAVRLYWFSQTIGANRGLEDAALALAYLPDSVELHLRGRWQNGYESRLRDLASGAGVAAARIVAHPPAAPDAMVACAAPMDIGLALEPPVSANNDILWSNKVFTFILAGLPVVLSRTTGQSLLARELDGAAVTYPPGDARGLAEALRPWIEQPALRAQAAERAWQLGERRFNWEIEQRTFLNVVEGVLASRTRAAS
jgi:glycosyltransferase involved in cell wall biosynthesis